MFVGAYIGHRNETMTLKRVWLLGWRITSISNAWCADAIHRLTTFSVWLRQNQVHQTMGLQVHTCQCDQSAVLRDERPQQDEDV